MRLIGDANALISYRKAKTCLTALYANSGSRNSNLPYLCAAFAGLVAP